MLSLPMADMASCAQRGHPYHCTSETVLSVISLTHAPPIVGETFPNATPIPVTSPFE